MVADQRRQQQQQVRPSRPDLPVARRRRARTGVKNIEGRVHNKTFKIKKLIAQPENVKVKKNGQVVRKMTVRRRAIFPGE